MTAFSRLRYFWQSLWRGRLVEPDIAGELRAHLDFLIAEKIDAGLSPQEARQAAQAQFGNINPIFDVCCEIRSTGISGWLRDARQAFKSSLGNPWPSALAAVILALGVGANIAIFRVINHRLLEPPLFLASKRLVKIQENCSAGEIDISNPDFLDLQSQSHSFDAMVSFATGPESVMGGATPERDLVAYVSRDFFPAFDTKQFMGRPLLASDHTPSAQPVVVLSHRAWQRLFPDQSLNGRKLTIAGRAYTVVGVAPPEFSFPAGADLWTARELFSDLTDRSAHNLNVIARLREGATLDDAQAEIGDLSRRLKEKYPESHQGISLAAMLLSDYQVIGIRPGLLFSLVAVGMVLLVGCASVSNLLLVRDADRQQTVIERLRLGASPRRILRRLMLECGLLAFFGGMLGLSGEILLFRPLSGLFPRYLTSVDGLGMDGLGLSGNLLAFAIGLSVLTALLCGFVPAIKLARLNAVKQSPSGNDRSVYLLRALVVSEIALAAILIIVAGLFIKDLRYLRRANPGFQSQDIITGHLSLPTETYQDNGRTVAFFGQTLSRIKRLPGVYSAAAVNNLPLRGPDINGHFFMENTATEDANAYFTLISSDYFQTMGIDLVKGRSFQAEDDFGEAPVAIVSHELATRLWRNDDPIGRRIRFQGMDAVDLRGDAWMTIVGIVTDVKHQSLGAKPWPEVYVPLAQRPLRAKDMTLVVKTSVDAGAITPLLANEIHSVDPDLPITWGTMDRLLSHSVAQKRAGTLFLTLIAVAALLLAAPGIYTVVSYSVGIQVRKPYSADDFRRTLIDSVKQGIALVSTGLAVGMAAVFVAMGLVGQSIVGFKRVDPIVLGVAAFVIVVATLVVSSLSAGITLKRTRPFLIRF